MGKKICSDLKPMFKEECKFLEKEIRKELPGEGWQDGLWMRYKTIWYNGRRLMKLSADGKPRIIKEYHYKDSLSPRKKPTVGTLRRANYSTLKKTEKEAIIFIRRVTKKYGKKLPVVSFSGGKDSTAVSYLTRKALRTNRVLHVFGDTTIEYPDTYKYIEKFQKENPKTPFRKARGGNDFIQICEKLEPPTMIIRWCCSVFKTGPMSNIMNKINGEAGVISFEGIRRAESVKRRNHQRIYDSKKIVNQLSVEPIIEWTDFTVWSYVISYKLTYNSAYEKGLHRVGCMYCPSNTAYTDYLLCKLYPSKMSIWFKFLKRYATNIGKRLPAEYVEDGSWKIRIGPASKNGISMVKQSCPRSSDITHYILNRAFLPKGIEVFKPLGVMVSLKSSLENALGIEGSDGNPDQHILVKDARTSEPLFGFQQEGDSNKICVGIFRRNGRYQLKQQIERQIRKFQSCVLCGACTGICPTGAVRINPHFHIQEEKCIHCGKCVSSEYIAYGCIGSDVLRRRRIDVNRI
jgi:phosphoadenosine phosphosulfate reductase